MRPGALCPEAPVPYSCSHFRHSAIFTALSITSAFLRRMSGRSCRTWCSTSDFASTAMETRLATKTAIRVTREVSPILRQLWILLTMPLFRPDIAIYFPSIETGGGAAALRVQSGCPWRWKDSYSRRDRAVRRQLPCLDRRADFPVLSQQLHCVRTERHSRPGWGKRLCLRTGIRAGGVARLRAGSHLQSDNKSNSPHKGYRSWRQTTPRLRTTFTALDILNSACRCRGRSLQRMRVIVSYAGNHGYDLFVANNHLNQNFGPNFTSFQGLPATSPDPRFGQVSSFSNDAISNYNGVSLQYKHIDHSGLTTDIAYTYSHSLDDISNGGNSQLPYSNGSLRFQLTPGLPSTLMYSSSDYDIRHNFVMDLVYAEPHRFSNKIVNSVAAGWTVGAKAYWRSGEPFSVLNASAGAALGASGTGGSVVLAQVLNNNFNHSCTSYHNPCFQEPGIFNGDGNTKRLRQCPSQFFPRAALFRRRYDPLQGRLQEGVFSFPDRRTGIQHVQSCELRAAE